MSYGYQEAGQAGTAPAPLDGARHLLRGFRLLLAPGVKRFVLPAAVAGGASLVSARLRDPLRGAASADS